MIWNSIYLPYRECLAFFKNNIKDMYHWMPKKDIYYFLKVAEFRFLMKNKTKKQYELHSEDYLNDLN